MDCTLICRDRQKSILTYYLVAQIVYQNNSPDTLYNFYLNLYGNAFQKGTVKYREYLQNLGRSYRGVKFREIEKYESYYDINAFNIERTGSVISDTFKVDDTILSAKLAKGLAPDQSMVISLEWVHYLEPNRLGCLKPSRA